MVAKVIFPFTSSKAIADIPCGYIEDGSCKVRTTCWQGSPDGSGFLASATNEASFSTGPLSVIAIHAL